MPELSTRTVGFLIAYIIPGFLLLWGLSFVSPDVRAMLIGIGESGPSVGGALLGFVSSLGAGMTASLFRWAFIDTAFAATGIKRPLLNDVVLAEKLEAVEHLIQQHYRYFQFYSNTVVAGVVAFVLWRLSPSGQRVSFGGPELLLLVSVVVFVAGSRDSLRKFYGRLGLLLGEAKGVGGMTNGSHPENEVQKGKNSGQQTKGKVGTSSTPAKQAPTAGAGNKAK